MGQSIGEMLATPETYWNWMNNEAARASVVYTVHELGLLDHVGPGPTSVGDIAARVGIDAELTRRLIEFLAAEGVLDADAGGNFLPNENSRKLAAAGGVAYCYGTLCNAATRLGEALRNGNRVDAWQLAMGKSLFELFAADPNAGRLFGEAMSFSTSATEPKTFEQHKFAPFELAVDIGGSHGYLMLRLMSE